MEYNTKRYCLVCFEDFKSDLRNLKRGWGLCCSKSCAAVKRERDNKLKDSNNIKKT